MRQAAILLLLLVGAPLPGQAQPVLQGERVEMLLYEAGRKQILRTTAGGAVTVVLAPGETIEQVSLGDTRDFQVEVVPPGEQMTVRALRPAPDTTMQVKSDRRSYDFLVQVGPDNEPAYTVRFGVLPPPGSLMAPPLSSPVPPTVLTTSYRLKGAKALRPTLVREDGAKTYIEWEEDQALPAVFSLNSAGDEETVDSYMRGGILTIDRVYDRLVFRLGKASASAERIIPKPKGRR